MSESPCILISNAPATIFVSGRSYVINSAGEKLNVSAEEAREIMNGPYGSRFTKITMEQPVTVKPLAAQVQEGLTDAKSITPTLDEQLYRPPVVTNVPESLTAVGAVGDRNELVEESEQEANSLMGQIANSLVKPQEVQEESAPEVPTAPKVAVPTSLQKDKKKAPPSFTSKAKSPAAVEVSETVHIPLDEDAHFSVVRRYLLDKEEAADPSLKLIAKAIKEKFPTYTSVLEECNRILEA